MIFGTMTIAEMLAAEKQRVYSWLNSTVYRAPVAGEGPKEKILRQIHNLYYKAGALTNADLYLAIALQNTQTSGDVDSNADPFISFGSQFIQGIRMRLSLGNETPPPMILTFEGPGPRYTEPTPKPYDDTGAGNQWGPTPAGTTTTNTQALINKWLPYGLLFFGAVIALQMVQPKGRRR